MPLAPTTPVVVETAQTDETPTEAITETVAPEEASAPLIAEATEAPVETAQTEAQPAESPAPEAAAVEPVLIEVWHLQRHHHRPHHHPRPDHAQRGERRPSGPRVAPAEAPGEAAPQAPRPRRAEHVSKPAFQGKRQEGNRPQEGRPPRDGQRPDGKRFDTKGRDERHKPRGAPFASTEAPKAREKQPDPDSPFAKLMALKAAMEQKKD